MFASREITFEGRLYRFRIYLPAEVNKSEKLPAMLYLHGSDERGTDNEGQLSGPAPAIVANRKNFSFAIVFPQCPQGRFWDAEMIRLANAELDQTVAEFGLDESRLYLAGFSLGGYGVWSAAVTLPKRFAALIPMSGRVLPRSNEINYVSSEVRTLAESPRPFTAYAQLLKDEPIWIFHGTNDPIVPVSNSRDIAKALREAGNLNFNYTELADTGHISMPIALAKPELFEWLSRQRR